MNTRRRCDGGDEGRFPGKSNHEMRKGEATRHWEERALTDEKALAHSEWHIPLEHGRGWVNSKKACRAV